MNSALTYSDTTAAGGTSTQAPTLSDLTSATGLTVFDYLDLDVSIPVVEGLQAQGDLIVVPHDLLKSVVTTSMWTQSVDVPLSGVELLRSAAGGNPHTLVAEQGRCTWRTRVHDPRGLALGIVETEVVAYLIHPEPVPPESHPVATSSAGNANKVSGDVSAAPSWWPTDRMRLQLI